MQVKACSTVHSEFLITHTSKTTSIKIYIYLYIYICMFEQGEKVNWKMAKGLKNWAG